MTRITSTRDRDRPLTLAEGLDDPTDAIMDRESQEPDWDRDYYEESRERLRRLQRAKRNQSGGTHVRI
jgi:hypothetical protein